MQRGDWGTGSVTDGMQCEMLSAPASQALSGQAALALAKLFHILHTHTTPSTLSCLSKILALFFPWAFFGQHRLSTSVSHLLSHRLALHPPPQ